jgi:hypothetical protein
LDLHTDLDVTRVRSLGEVVDLVSTARRGDRAEI